MKKKLLLLITLVCLVVFTPNVSAKSNATARYQNYPGSGRQNIESGITYAGEGNLNPSDATRGDFLLWNQYIEMNGKLYKAWCVDPALHSPGGANYTCTPLKDAGLQYIFDNLTGDETTDAFAFRFYAIYADIGMKIVDENGKEVTHSSLNYQKAAIIRYLQVRGGVESGDNNDVIKEYGSDYTQFLSGNTEAIEKAYEIAKKAAELRQVSELNEATSGDGSGLKYTTSTYDAMSVTYVITSTFPMKKENMEFTCENCRSVDILNWSDYSVTLRVNQLSSEGDGCRFTINASFKNKGMYGCYGGEGNQFEVIVVDDPTETKIPFNAHNPKCGGPLCCEEEPLDNELDGVVANCCEETTHSYVKEYDLDDLFCYHDGLKVPHYWEKCGADAYKDTEINEYCDLYCTERVTIDVPGAITAKSGSYFTLTKNPVGNTTSPYIQGFKRCRIRVKYDTWEKDYIKVVREEVKAYNEYQKNMAFKLSYDNLIADGKSDTKTISISCSATASVDDCDTCGGDLIPNSNPPAYTDKTSCGGASKSDSTTLSCTVKYKRHELKSSLLKNYYGAKIKNDNNDDKKPIVDNHLTVNMTYDAIKSGLANFSATGHSDWVATEIDLSDCNAKEADKEKEDAVSVSTTSCGSDTAKWSCSYDASEITNHEVNLNSIKDSYAQSANSFANQLSAQATNAKNLEEKLSNCDTYFDTKSGNEMYEFNPTMIFRYNQIYRNDSGRSSLATIEIPFKETPGCTITGPEKGDINYEGGMDTASPRYSETYGTGNMLATDFSGSLRYSERANDFSGMLDTTYNANKLFTHDARYKAVCEWEEEPNNVNTLVPNGAVNESAIANFTRHEYEYKVFLTTYDGTFETDWEINNIGENDKIDDFIREHGGTTCAGNTADKESKFSCALHVEYEIVYTGKCNGTTVNPDDCDPVKNVEGLFQFKVANPSDIFPTGTTTDTGAPIAKNWTDTAEGQATKAEIEQNGERGLTYAQERETYKFHLTPEIMRHIKNYNVTRNQGNIGGYSDFNMTCDCPSQVQTNTAQGGGVGCTKCRSNLLSDLANNSISYEGQTYTVKAWSSQKSIDQVRNESHWR